MSKHLTITALSGLLLLAGCGRAELGVKGGEPVIYSCGAQKIEARYYCLTDDSLSFVKLRLPDGHSYTLPQTVSASGVRYTDEFELIWWTKGDEAFAEMRDASGAWQVRYPDCRIAKDADQPR